MKNLFFGLALMLVGTLAFANSSMHHFDNAVITTNLVADGDINRSDTCYMVADMIDAEYGLTRKEYAQVYHNCMSL
jgi:hypothetical protein